MADTGNEAQLRLIMDQVAEAAVTNLLLKQKAQQLDQPKEAPVPALVKWLVGAIAGLGSAALVGLGVWLVSSVSEMSNTLARLDERMKGADTAQLARDAGQDERIRRLEAYHQGGAR